MSLRQSLLTLVAVLLATPSVCADSDKENTDLRKELKDLREESARRVAALEKLLKQREQNEKQLILKLAADQEEALRRVAALEKLLKQRDQNEKQLIIELATAHKAIEVRKQELANLRTTIDQLQRDRERLTAAMNEARKERIRAEIEAKTLAARNLQIEAQLQQLSHELARLKQLLAVEATPRKGDNFPPNRVEGQVAAVDAESKLLKLSIGSDAGLSKGHTLHVYRIDPVPEKSRYLGKVEILDVNPKESVARLVGSAPGPIRAGDRVGSGLLPAEKK